MKSHVIMLLIALTLVTINVTGQNNPFEKFGYTPGILTLSNGEYEEFFDNDTIVRIGSALYNTISQHVIGFIEDDTIYSEATLEPEIVSRWLSPDPLARKYPQLSPYNFCANNPIIFIDPDGRSIVPADETSNKAMYQSFSATFGEDVGTFLYEIMLTKNKFGNQGLQDMNSDKIFKTLLKTIDSKELKTKMTVYYAAIKSDRVNFIDVFAEMGEFPKTGGGTYVSLKEGIDEVGTIDKDGFEFKYDLDGKQSTTSLDKHPMGKEGSYTIVKTDNPEKFTKDTNGSTKGTITLTPEDNEKIYEGIKAGNETEF